jgi:hypothetical protein
MSATLAPPRADAPPLYATRRTPSRRTHGGAIGAVARAMGGQLMGHQQYVADVATEVLDDGSWAYPVVVVELQRQGGKTHLVNPMACERCATRRDAMAWFTAQTRQDARDTFTEGYMRRLEASPLGSRIKSRRSNGSEGLWFPTGSTFRVFAPTPDAMHGKANELVVVDEGWAFTGARGLELEQAILPTFTTTGGQLWIISAAGHGESEWLRSWVERGRAAVELGRTEGVAYFKWGLDPALVPEVEQGLEAGHLDPDSSALTHALDLVLAAHPAAGPGGTLHLGALRSAALTMRPGEFLRAYATVWTATEERVIPAEAWARGQLTPEAWPPPALGTAVALGVDVALDRSDAAVVAAWRDRPDGPLRWDVLERRTGSASWVPGYVQDLRARRAIRGVGHNGGPAADVADELERAGVPTIGLGPRDYATACGQVLRTILDGQLHHLAQGPLEAAVAAAARRELGDGMGWGRRQSAASIASLVAGTAATWAFDHAPAHHHPRSRP